MRKAKQTARSPSKTKKSSLRKMFFAGFHVGQKSKTKRKRAGKACAKSGKKKMTAVKKVARPRKRHINQKLYDLCLRNAHREMWDVATDAQMREAARIDYNNALKDPDFRNWLQDEYG